MTVISSVYKDDDVKCHTGRPIRPDGARLFLFTLQTTRCFLSGFFLSLQRSLGLFISCPSLLKSTDSMCMLRRLAEIGE